MIHAHGGARNDMTFAEEKSEEEIDDLRERIFEETSEDRHKKFKRISSVIF